MNRRTETLARINLFRSLDAAKIELLDTQCFWQRAARNQWIIDYQDTSNDVFFVVSGTLRVKIQSVAGREVLLREINAGEFFGELAAIDNQPRSSGIFTVTDVTLARMPASVFRAAVHAHPDVCDQLLEQLAGYVRTISNRVTDSRLMLTRAARSACTGGGETTACCGFPASGRDSLRSSA